MSLGNFPSLVRDALGNLLPWDQIVRRLSNLPSNNGRPAGVVTAPNRPPNRPVGRDLHKPENWNTNNSGAQYTCSLSSEPNGGALTWEFDPDPTAVFWALKMDNQVVPTRGGQVTYAKFRQIGPLIIIGKMRSTYDLLQFSFFVQEHMVEAQMEGKSLLFEYPEREMAYYCYVRDFQEIGINTQESGDMVVKYQITLDITRDHVDLASIPLSELGIPEEVGWTPVSEAADIAESERPGSTMTTPNERSTPGPTGLGGDGQAPGSSSPGS